MSKKISLSIFLGVLVLTAYPLGFVLAQLQPYAPGAPQVGSIHDIISSIELLAGLLFGAIAVICFVISGILFLSSQGDPEKLRTARSSLYWGFAGVVVGIIAFSIIAIVGSALSGGGGGFGFGFGF